MFAVVDAGDDDDFGFVVLVGFVFLTRLKMASLDSTRTRDKRDWKEEKGDGLLLYSCVTQQRARRVLCGRGRMADGGQGASRGSIVEGRPPKWKGGNP